MTNDIELTEARNKSVVSLRLHLESIGACKDARLWSANKTASEAWLECEKPEWLFWWASHTPINTHQQIVRGACACARSVLHLVPDGELRPLWAIEAAERWADDPTEENRKVCRMAADAASDAASYAANIAADGSVSDANGAEKQNLCNLIRTKLTQPCKQ